MRIINFTATSAGTDYIDLPRGDWVAAIQARSDDAVVNVAFSTAPTNFFTIKANSVLEISIRDRETKEFGIQADASTIVEIFLIPNLTRRFVLGLSNGAAGGAGGGGNASITYDIRANILATGSPEAGFYYATDTEELFVYDAVAGAFYVQPIEYQVMADYPTCLKLIGRTIT